MSRFEFLFLLALFLPGLAFAKRAAPVKVEPVIYEGVRYVAPNNDGLRAYIQAWNVQTNQKLWELTVFTNRIDPKLEEDVQWVFIKKMKVRDGLIFITSERGTVYRIDLKTRSTLQRMLPLCSLRSLRLKTPVPCSSMV